MGPAPVTHLNVPAHTGQERGEGLVLLVTELALGLAPTWEGIWRSVPSL